jgi:transcriptional regulator with XRE-family HTH domain
MASRASPHLEFIPLDDSKLALPWFAGRVWQFVEKRVGPLSRHGYRFQLKEYHEQLGEVLETARHMDVMTQKELAEAINKLLGDRRCGQPWIDKLESRAAASLARFAATAQALRYPPSVLVLTAEAALILRLQNRDYHQASQRADAITMLLTEMADVLGREHTGPPSQAPEAARAWCGLGQRVHTWFAAAVGTALKRARLSRGQSQSEVANELSTRFGYPPSKATLCQAERGHATVSWERLAALGQVLRIALSHLFFVAEEEAFLATRPTGDRMRELLGRVTEVLNKRPPGDENREVFDQLQIWLEEKRRRDSAAREAGAPDRAEDGS